MMTIEQAMEAKEKLELDILDLLQGFKTQTGLCPSEVVVSTVAIDRIGQRQADRIVSEVEVTAEL